MIDASDFLDQCKNKGYRFFSGTPCSYLKPLINRAIDDSEISYYGATNEGDAVAMACGAYLAQQKGVAIFQNSGFGNAVNALSSLAYTFRIPLLVVITLRGQPDGPPDEPQHELMGQITEEMLNCLRIKWAYLPDNVEELEQVFEEATRHMDETQQPFAFVMKKNCMHEYALAKKTDETPIGTRKIDFSESLQKTYSARPTRTDILKIIVENRRKNDALIATTGKTGRELYTIDDSKQHLYMVGSMGSASSLALGAALTLPTFRFIVLDGDAAILMRMGNLATIGAFQAKNLVHIVLDNETNDSTGGQSSVSKSTSLAAIAQACGYSKIFSIDDPEEFRQIFQSLEDNAGPSFIHLRIKSGSPKDLGRPKVKPFEVKERLMNFLKESP